MVRIINHDTRDDTTEDMSILAHFLLSNNFAKCTNESGFQKSSVAECGYVVHVIKKTNGVIKYDRKEDIY